MQSPGVSDEGADVLAARGNLTPEEIKELLEKSVEVDMDVDEFDMSQFTAFLENLEKEAGAPMSDQDLPDDAPVMEVPSSQTGQPVDPRNVGTGTA